MIDLSKTIFITMDLDWACDEVIEDSLNLIDDAGIPVTIFVTHQTSLLERMRKNSLIRLGIHPNFNPLLNNQGDKDYLTVIREIKSLVPEAVSARSHGLVNSTGILQAFQDAGITHDLNLFIPFSPGVNLKPFRHFNGMLRLPYFFEDDVQCQLEKRWKSEEHILQSGDGLRIFNFHPIHLFLNSEKLDNYNNAKPFMQDFQALKQFVNPDPARGTRVFWNHIIRVAKANGFDFAHVEDL
jgi:hypothetical protein